MAEWQIGNIGESPRWCSFLQTLCLSSTDELMKVKESVSLLAPMKVYYNKCINDSTVYDNVQLKDEFYEAFSSTGYTFSFDEDSYDTDTENVTSVLASMMKNHV